MQKNMHGNGASDAVGLAAKNYEKDREGKRGLLAAAAGCDGSSNC